MKKLFLLIGLIIGTNVVLAQTAFSYEGLKYCILNQFQNEVAVFGFADGVTGVTNLEIPNEVTHNGTTYTVVSIGGNASNHNSQFQQNNTLESVNIPNSVRYIKNYAFKNCSKLKSVNIPNSVTNINEQAFYNCDSLTSITIPNSVTTMGTRVFEGCDNLTSVTFGTFDNLEDNNSVNVDKYTFKDCTNLRDFIYIKHYAPKMSNYTFDEMPLQFFKNTPDDKTLTIICADKPTQWSSTINNAYYAYDNLIECTSWGKVVYLVPAGKTKTIATESDLTSLENNRIIIVKQGGQLINETSNNNLGIVEVETASLPNDKWSFIGAPFAGYKLESVVPGTRDISVSTFNYGTGAWSDEWSTIETQIGAGEGFFAWSYATEPTIFTNYGDGMYSPNAHSDYSDYNYDFNSNPAYQLNNGDVTVTKTLTTNGGNWMALANPYTFKLDVAKFLADQAACMADQVQGKVIYKFDGTQFTPEITGVINVTEGFFVNFNHNGTHSATFKKSQRFDSPANSAKASIEREFVRLAMLDGEREIELLFAQNEQANEEYDIFDANKLFSPVEIAEPYFVLNNIELVKEEVNTLPYYATMNVKSYGNKEVTFKANYIPEGLAVSIIDGEETIDLGEGVEYTTNIIAGENADRFKVLIKKSLSISDAEELDVNIYNDNRHINIETLENDLQVEVYNALGQKVLSTIDRNFTLNQVSAGAYVVKAFNNKASKTQKILVK